MVDDYEDSIEWGRVTDLVARSVEEFALPGEDVIEIRFGDPDRESRRVNITAAEITEVCTQVLNTAADWEALDAHGFQRQDDQHSGPWRHDSVCAAWEIAANAVDVVRTVCGIGDPVNTEIAGGGPSARVGEVFFDAIDYGWADAAVWIADAATWTAEERPQRLTANHYYQRRSLQDGPDEDEADTNIDLHAAGMHACLERISDFGGFQVVEEPVMTTDPVDHYWHVLHPGFADVNSTAHWYGRMKTREEASIVWARREVLRQRHESRNSASPQTPHLTVVAKGHIATRSPELKVCLDCLWASSDRLAEHPEMIQL